VIIADDGGGQVSVGGAEAGAPLMPSRVLMRVRSTLRLRCHVQSSGSQQYDVTWFKDGRQLLATTGQSSSSSQKYLLTSDTPSSSSLAIADTGQ